MGELFNLIRFFDSGGPILWSILLVAIALWTLIIERYWYHWRVFPLELAALRSLRGAATYQDRHIAQMMIRRDVSRLRLRLIRSLTAIRTLIAACPLLGLLGTVTGMIVVFDTIAFSGTGTPRAIASGVSMATIPTMAGLVVALSGFIFNIRLQRGSSFKVRLASETLLLDMLAAEENYRKANRAQR